MNKKATARPTVGTRQAAQAKADRRAEALARRADRAAGVETCRDDIARVYRHA